MAIDRAAGTVSDESGGFAACYRNLLALDREQTRPAWARRCLQAIDQCLNELEELHLEDRHLARQLACQRVVDVLVGRTGVRPPDDVTSARSSYALHAALLDWQGSLLDQLVPNRQQRFPDSDPESERWIPPRVQRPRPTLSGPKSHEARADRASSAGGAGQRSQAS